MTHPTTTKKNKKSLNALDRSFLAAESREVMMHVGALMEFAPPPAEKKGSSSVHAELARTLRDEVSQEMMVESPWNLRLLHPDLLKSPVQSWVADDSFDIEYHLRRSALPSPGDERELGSLVSRLHGTPLDFQRPPWEVHFIEGLGGKRERLALYFKVHHSLVDGYTGMRLLARSFSTSPNDLDTPLFFTLPPQERKPHANAGGDDAHTHEVATLASLFGAAREQIGVAKDIGRALVNVVRSRRGGGGEEQPATPLQAPKSILNQRISRARRFATQSVSLEHIKEIATRSGGTLNDVVLAICGAGLRRFLLEQDALPDRPLIAMVPVNIRPKDDPGGGNAVGAILATLATDIKDPRAALDQIILSTKRAKAQLQGMSKNAIMQYSALILAPMMLSFIPGAAGRLRPGFNVVISNVPGPEKPLYFRGWRLEETYPLSIPFHGYGLNITVQSYAGSFNFGFTGCRDTVPHLQRLAIYSGEAANALLNSKSR